MICIQKIVLFVIVNVVQVGQVVQVALVIKFVNTYCLHGLNNQIIVKT